MILRIALSTMLAAARFLELTLFLFIDEAGQSNCVIKINFSKYFNSNLKRFRYHVLSVAHAVLGGLILATEGSRILEFFQASVFGYWTNRE